MANDQDTTPLPNGLALMGLDPAFLANPHPALDLLRERAPMYYDEFLKRYFLTRAEDAETVLRDRDLSVDPRKAPPGAFDAFLAQQQAQSGRSQSMLFLDPPDHDRLRGLVNKAFTPRAVERMAPRIQQIADELLDGLEGRETFDLIADYSAPLPTIVIAEMLGVDSRDQARFKEWSDLIVQNFNPFMTEDQRAKVNAAGQEMDAYLKAAVEARRQDRRDDLISAMVDAEEQGNQMTDEEIVTMCVLLLAAGNLTTTDLIGNGMLALLQNPEQFEKLKADPSLIKNAVEEMLRFDPPVMQSARRTLADMEISGCPIHAGSALSVSLTAANHDPSVHPDPHRFDITREDTTHVSFGGGRRYCLGAPLARLEAQIAVNSLIQRFPTLHLTGETLTHRRIPVFRGLERLPVAK